MRLVVRVVVVTLAMSVGASAINFPGTKGSWNGFDRYDLVADGLNIRVVAPAVPAAGNPWVMRGEFPDYHTEVDVALLGRGYHIVFTDGIVQQFGCPTAISRWNTLYATMTTQYGLAAKAVLEGISRSGLLVHNWGAQNPAKVACILGYVPVCDFKSWPKGLYSGRGNPTEWQNLLAAWGMTEPQALAYDKNPIDNLAPLAAAGIRILHLVGDADVDVPPTENAEIVYDRYRALGGTMQLIVVPGGDHAAWIADVSPIVDFVTGPGAPLPSLNSGGFAHKYEGDVWPPAEYPQSAGTATSDGDILSYTASGSTFAETTAAMPQSYTIEFKLKVDSQTAGKQGVFDLWISNAADPSDTVFLFVAKDAVKVFHYGTLTYDNISLCTNDDAYHTFRIAHKAGTGVFQLWRDEVRIGTDILTSNYAGGNDLWWLGGSGAIGGTGRLDYFRWTEGAYAPPARVAVRGRIAAQGFFGDNSTIQAQVQLTPLGSGATVTRSVDLNADGTFTLDNITTGTYTVAVKTYASLVTVLDNADILGNPTDLGTIDLRGGDSSGDAAVSFEDFSILQNSYGQHGGAVEATGPSASAAMPISGGCGPLGLLLLMVVALASCGLHAIRGE